MACHPGCVSGRWAVDPDRTKDGSNIVPAGAAGKAQPQGLERVKGVGRRHSEWHAEMAGAPHAVPVGKDPLWPDLGRAACAVVAQQSGRTRLGERRYRHPSAGRGAGRFAGTRRRDKVEVPLDGPSHWVRSPERNRDPGRAVRLFPVSCADGRTRAVNRYAGHHPPFADRRRDQNLRRVRHTLSYKSYKVPAM